MAGRVVHFEIPIDEADRAGMFYRDVFGWQVQQWGSEPYWTVSAGDRAGDGAEGALAPRSEAPEGVLVYVAVDDIDATLAKVKQAGGDPLTGRMPIPSMGWSARFRDSEGNQVGLFQHDPSVPPTT
jgi:predicted enzyme related to lactoylglutathione lyase